MGTSLGEPRLGTTVIEVLVPSARGLSGLAALSLAGPLPGQAVKISHEEKLRMGPGIIHGTQADNPETESSQWEKVSPSVLCSALIP